MLVVESQSGKSLLTLWHTWGMFIDPNIAVAELICELATGWVCTDE